jgi:putative zinc finger/helix-turn-helix YgiT family protein
MTVIKTIRDACPHCDAMRDIEVVRERETMKIRGEDVEFESEFMVCKTCGKDYADGIQMDTDLETARSVYRERHGIIGPEELVALRKRYDVSQKSFAKILDIGDLTINSYEQGVLPSGAHNSLLKLASVPENFRRLYEANKGNLSDRQRAKIERALAAMDRAADDDVADRNKTSAPLQVKEEAPPYGPSPQSSPERLMEVTQLLLAYAGAELYKMAVLKLLFYVDFSYYARTGHSVTGWRYARLPYGPVPDDYKEILCEGEKAGLFSLTMDDNETGEHVSLPEYFDIDIVKAEFSPSELEIIELVAKRLGNLPASALRELTHEEKAWIETEPAQLISWEYASSLVHGV